MFAGQVIVGSSTSFTVIVCAHVALLPFTSHTVQVTVVTPTGYVPLALTPPLKLLVMLSNPQLSLVPVGSGTISAALHAPTSLVVVMFAGQVIVGSSTSFTVIVC